MYGWAKGRNNACCLAKKFKSEGAEEELRARGSEIVSLNVTYQNPSEREGNKQRAMQRARRKASLLVQLHYKACCDWSVASATTAVTGRQPTLPPFRERKNYAEKRGDLLAAFGTIHAVGSYRTHALMNTSNVSQASAVGTQAGALHL